MGGVWDFRANKPHQLLLQYPYFRCVSPFGVSLHYGRPVLACPRLSGLVCSIPHATPESVFMERTELFLCNTCSV